MGIVRVGLAGEEGYQPMGSTAMRGVSERAAAVAESATLAITAKAAALRAAGEQVIGFGAGEPDFATPEPIARAAADAAAW